MKISYKKTCINCDTENEFDYIFDTTQDWEDWYCIDLDFIWQKQFVCKDCWNENVCWDLDWEII